MPDPLQRMPALLAMMLLAGAATAEPLALTLPGKATLSIDAPPLTKLKETSEGQRYQYVASSIDHADQRFNLSVFVEPIGCQFGTALKEVTRCFLEKSDRIPGIAKETRNTRCDERRCDVMYVTVLENKDSAIVLLHTNTIVVYQDRWVDIHFSVVSPTEEDKSMLTRLIDSVSFEAPAN